LKQERLHFEPLLAKATSKQKTKKARKIFEIRGWKRNFASIIAVR